MTSTNNTGNVPPDNSEQQQQHGFATTVDLYADALRAIEDDNLEKMKTLIELGSFTKDSLDNLFNKACERSKDISVEEDYIKNSGNISNFEEGQSMLSICRTERKRNEKLLGLLVEAEFQAESFVSNSKSSHQKTIVKTPPKPKFKSMEKTGTKLVSTPELPKFKSKTHRALKY